MQRVLSGILQAMLRFHWNPSALTNVQIEDLVSSGHSGGSRNDHPMFAPLVVQLQRESPSGTDRHPLHLVAWSLFENGVGAPWTMDSEVFQMLRRTLLLQNLNDLFHVLSARLGTAGRRARPTHPPHRRHSDCRATPPITVDHRPLTVDVHDAPHHNVTGLIRCCNLVQTAPTPDIGPTE